MQKEHILKKVNSGETVEVPCLLLVNGEVPQGIGPSIDESIKKWGKDTSLRIEDEHDLLTGKICGSKAGMLECGNGVSLEFKKKLARQEEERQERSQFLATEILND